VIVLQAEDGNRDYKEFRRVLFRSRILLAERHDVAHRPGEADGVDALAASEPADAADRHELSGLLDEGGHEAALLVGGLPVPPRQIGRASCRDRWRNGVAVETGRGK